MKNKEPALGEKTEYKFLGKEVAYYDGIFRIWQAIMRKIEREEDPTNLINHLDSSFPYKDDMYLKEIGEAQEVLTKALRTKDRSGKADLEHQRKAITEFTMLKYSYLIRLMKRKKVLPNEAEEEEW